MSEISEAGKNFCMREKLKHDQCGLEMRHKDKEWPKVECQR